MKFITFSLLLSVAPVTLAFTLPMQTSSVRPSIQGVRLSMVEEAVGSDVSIPYDAAARLAYDEWRALYNKGPFDEKRYGNFKNNYETVTVANVIAKKRAREDGTVSLSLLTLNEFGDLSAIEYERAMQQTLGNPSAPTTTGDVLSKALEAAELQVQASNALGEAADALAEEEQKLMEMLGLESIDELEIAIDSLEGIAPDGGELDTANIAREARIRDAYLKWCKEYRKEPDESRYPTFSNNFLMLEQYAKETAKEMTLNQYADFTKEEYEAMQSGTTVASASSASSEPDGAMGTSAAPMEQAMSGIEKILARAAKAAQEARDSIESSLKSAGTVAKSVDLTANREEILESAGSGIEKVMEIAAKSIDAGLQAIEDTSSTSTETEEEREARLARMKALEEERIEAEKKAAEARAKRAAELAEKAKQEAARRKEIEEERAAREKLMLAEAAKAKVEAEKRAIAAAKAEAEREAARAAERAKVEAQAAQKLREQARAWDEQQKKLNAKKTKVVAPKKSWMSGIFPDAVKPAQSTPAAKKAPVVKKTVAPAAPSFSFFPPASAQPAKKKTVVQPKKASPAPSTPFSFFPAPSKAPAKKVSTPPPAPMKKPAETTSGFSFFAPSKPAVVKKATPPAPAPAKAPAFSFFVAPSTEKPKVDVKVPNKSGSISLFASKPLPKKDVKVPSRGGTISIFSASKEATPKAPTKPFSLFSTPKAEPKKQAPVTKKPDVQVPNRAGTFSLFGGLSSPAADVKAPPNVPVLSNWRQNADGSISGKVSNSKSFQTGAEITTSPVKKGAKSGTVVKTGSGSQYYLK